MFIFCCCHVLHFLLSLFRKQKVLNGIKCRSIDKVNCLKDSKKITNKYNKKKKKKLIKGKRTDIRTTDIHHVHTDRQTDIQTDTVILDEFKLLITNLWCSFWASWFLLISNFLCWIKYWRALNNRCFYEGKIMNKEYFKTIVYTIRKERGLFVIPVAVQFTFSLCDELFCNVTRSLC